MGRIELRGDSNEELIGSLRHRGLFVTLSIEKAAGVCRGFGPNLERLMIGAHALVALQRLADLDRPATRAIQPQFARNHFSMLAEFTIVDAHGAVMPLEILGNRGWCFLQSNLLGEVDNKKTSGVRKNDSTATIIFI